jgi:hypothetical protein
MLSLAISARGIPVGVGIVLVAAASFLVEGRIADNTAKDIERSAALNEATAESAPQQQVVAAWAIRDATVAQVRQNGERDGLLSIAVIFLGVIAFRVGRPRPQNDQRTVAESIAPSATSDEGSPSRTFSLSYGPEGASRAILPQIIGSAELKDDGWAKIGEGEEEEPAKAKGWPVVAGNRLVLRHKDFDEVDVIAIVSEDLAGDTKLLEEIREYLATEDSSPSLPGTPGVRTKELAIAAASLEFARERQGQTRHYERREKDRQSPLSTASEGDDSVFGRVEGLSPARVSTIADLQGVRSGFDWNLDRVMQCN